MKAKARLSFAEMERQFDILNLGEQRTVCGGEINYPPSGDCFWKALDTYFGGGDSMYSVGSKGNLIPSSGVDQSDVLRYANTYGAEMGLQAQQYLPSGIENIMHERNATEANVKLLMFFNEGDGAHVVNATKIKVEAGGTFVYFDDHSSSAVAGKQTTGRKKISEIAGFMDFVPISTAPEDAPPPTTLEPGYEQPTTLDYEYEWPTTQGE